MRSFRDDSASRMQRAGKSLLTKPVRSALLRIPFLPAGVARVLDDIRFVEPDVLRFIRNTVKPGWCCVDVGAHCGTVTVRLAKLVGPAGFVLAIEPVLENAALLERNLKSRGFLPRCAIVRSAIGSVEGQLGMVRGEHSTTWRLAPSGDNCGEPNQVSVLRLDSLLDARRELHLVKVDIEGAEVDLVAGAHLTLSRSRPLWLFEMHGPASWTIVTKFLQLQYRAFDLNGSEISDGPADPSGYGHVVFCPAEKMTLLG